MHVRVNGASDNAIETQVLTYILAEAASYHHRIPT